MTNRIVVGITDAPVSRRALDWAVQRAADRRQTVELISVVGGAVGAVGERAVIEEAMETSRQRLEDEVRRIEERGVVATVRVERGNPVKRLIDAAADAALLVIGSDYRGPDSGPARGAHGVRIVSGARCPVVVVPDLDVSGRSGVLVGADGSDVSERAIAFAAAEADRMREPLTVVTVWTPVVTPHNPGVYPEEYLRNMQSLAEEALALSVAGLRQDYPDLEIVKHVEEGYPSEILNRMAGSARLAVLGSHGRGAVARLLLGSISEEVLARLATITSIVR
ncbi:MULTISPECIES: universal stress protein [unclassified Microbacterium]|uniref:universal stress protein n=1 Tax=unclassified Microbacterium TaxID=2609290 RepID=UPI00214B3EC5|nr:MULTISPECIES: universal stress protein [unclassified Microbacterium]MCR2808860.1 universal stress protein [Microbacterium sp. zg.B185]WIM18721.1 universal stress protein [Microbacterium sp. zg-B185]